METLDWDCLERDVVPDNKKIAYEPNKHLFKKVAFDVYRLNSSPTESLWILEDGEDGKQYLVAQYEEESENIEVKGSNWLALPDKTASNVTLFYKDVPIKRFASSEYGFSAADVNVFQGVLVEKLSSDKAFVEKLLNTQTNEQKDTLLKQFPELA
jgi:hypothetical protein